MAASIPSPFSASAVSILVAFLGAAALPSQDVKPDPELRKRFGFAASDVRKVSDGVHALRIADLDKDGLDEVVVFDGERARFTVFDLTREDDGTVGYDERHIDSEGQVYGSVVCDADGDGTLDLVYLDSRGRLVALAGAQVGGMRRTIEVGPASRSDAVRAGDLDGDGRSELIVATQSGLRVVEGLLSTNPNVSEAVPLGERRFGLFGLFDLDGDGALDLCLGTDVPRTPLWVRLGDGEGGFGSWLLLPMEPFQSCFAGSGVEPGKSVAQTLVVVDRSQWRATEYALVRSDDPDAPALSFESFDPLKRGAFPFAQTDVDGDGAVDLVLAHPDRAELTFLLERGGRFERRTVATLDKVDNLSVGDVDGDGTDDLVLVSSGENLVAWRAGGWPLERFPERLPLPDEATPVSAWVATGGGAVDVMIRDKRRKASVCRIARSAEAKVGFAEPTTLVDDLGRVSGEPLRTLRGEFDGDGVPDLAFVLPGDGLWLLRGTEDGGYTDKRVGEAGFTDKIDDGAIGLVAAGTAGVDSDRLFVVKERFARTVRLAGDDELDILDQENGPPSAQMALGVVQGDGTRLFLDRDSNKLFRVSEGAPVRTIDVPGIGATHLLAHGDDVLILGREGVVRVPRGAGYSLDVVRSIGRLGEESRPFEGLAADLDGDGAREALLIDEDFNGVHVLVAQGEKWVSALAFPVFEVGQKYEPVWEPTELATGDVDGDGQADLVLLCHDRVLVYRQGESQ